MRYEVHKRTLYYAHEMLCEVMFWQHRNLLSFFLFQNNWKSVQKTNKETGGMNQINESAH
jgi:hypothetical protein